MPVVRMTTSAGVVIPIRAFALGKARLADTLDAAARASLGQRWAEQVVHAAAPMTTLVVSSDPDVRDWAARLGLGTIDDPGTLDAAAALGRDRLRELGCTRAVIAHADLPYARALDRLARDGSQPVVALVPCHRDDGTPVLSVPTAVDFLFAYGPESFRRHAREARRLGLGLRVVRDRDLAFDVDVPDDLVELATDLQASPAP
jgi:2-phospho-L-lactate/phosphoenolpyruvate guanylyltransferase